MVDLEGTDADILERFDFELEDLVDKDKFSKALDAKFRVRQEPSATRKQIDGFFDAFDLTKSRFPAKGISTAKFLRLGKPQVRFGIKGFRGLFGISRTLKFFRTGQI